MTRLGRKDRSLLQGRSAYAAAIDDVYDVLGVWITLKRLQCSCHYSCFSIIGDRDRRKEIVEVSAIPVIELCDEGRKVGSAHYPGAISWARIGDADREHLLIGNLSYLLQQ